MYCKPSYRVKSVVFCSALCIHILILFMFFITYQLKNVLSCNLYNRLTLPQHQPKTAPLIFQQPKLQDPKKISNVFPESPCPAEKLLVTDVLHTRDVEATRTTDLVLPKTTKESEPSCIQHTTDIKKDVKNSVKKRSIFTKKLDRKIELKQLFQSFSNNISQERMKTARRSSDTYDLVLDNYKRKLCIFFNKAVCFRPNILYGSENIATIAEICITFNEKGVITKFEFKHPLPQQKLQAVEDTIKKLIYSSGLFPPIPRTLTPHDTYTFSLLVDVKISEGIHRYSFINK